jgi:hypothetical protein
MLTCNFFSPLRTTDVDTETTATEDTLPEQEAPRKSGRPPPVVMTFTTNLILLQSDLKKKKHVKGEYELRNTRNEASVVTNEMADYSVLKSYLEENYDHYFSSNSEKPIKAVIHHLLPDRSAEDISNILEDLGFSVINVRQITTNQRTPNEETYVETLSLFLVALTKRISQEMFKPNSLNHIIIKVELFRIKTSLTQCYNCEIVDHVLAIC